jgi:hypothetical protein
MYSNRSLSEHCVLCLIYVILSIRYVKMINEYIE